ncbi:MAG: BolA/IbaG family iron-sulfur metabolism protein [Candidatus Rickettsia vulgarisii]
MAISAGKLEEIIRNSFPNAKIKIKDYLGNQDHYSLKIEDSSFEGLSLVNQHKMVKKALTEIMNSNELHAITIETITPK